MPYWNILERVFGELEYEDILVGDQYVRGIIIPHSIIKCDAVCYSHHNPDVKLNPFSPGSGTYAEDDRTFTENEGPRSYRGVEYLASDWIPQSDLTTDFIFGNHYYRDGEGLPESFFDLSMTPRHKNLREERWHKKYASPLIASLEDNGDFEGILRFLEEV